MRILLSLAVAIAMLWTVPLAHCAIAQFIAKDIQFDDGGTANGTFSVDTDTLLFTDFDVVTTPGSVVKVGFEYNRQTAHISEINFQYPYVTLISNEPDLAGFPRWMPLSLTASPWWVEVQISADSPLRSSIGGEIIGQIPEPVASGFIVTGLLTMGLLIRRSSLRVSPRA
jgi:hypothetical protein